MAAGSSIHLTSGDIVSATDGNDLFYGDHTNFQDVTIKGLGFKDTFWFTDANPFYVGPGHPDYVTAYIDNARNGIDYSYTYGQDNTYTYGAFTLSPVINGRLALTNNASGGIDVVAVAKTDTSDYNGDGRSDLIFSNTSGQISTWYAGGDSGPDIFNKDTFNLTALASWRLVGSLDANADGVADLLWRNLNGTISVWTGKQAGFVEGAYTSNPIDKSWNVAGLGHMIGNGPDDILFENSNDGSLSIWAAYSNGTGYFENAYFHPGIDAAWKVLGVGDFNGDGKGDILFRNTNGDVSIWTEARVQVSSEASTSGNGQVLFGPEPQFKETYIEDTFYQHVDNSWHAVGIGDFDGDGKSDILWQNDNGTITVWQSIGSNFTEGTRDAVVAADWHVAAVGDYNGDGLSDILFRNNDGSVSTWHSNGSSFAQNTYFDGSVAASWQIAAHDFL